VSDIQLVPPSNTDAEVSVIGSILINNSLIDSVSEILTREDFYSTVNQNIFGAIVDVYNNGSAVDLVILKNELSRLSILEKSGGVIYLMNIVDAVPITVNVVHYAEIIKEKKLKRDLITATAVIQKEAYDDSLKSDTLLELVEKKVYDITQRKFRNNNTDIDKLLIEAWDHIESMQEHTGAVTGVPTGFKSLDEITSGFQRGELIVVAARPSMGKTSFMLNIAENVSMNNKIPVLIFSMEMSALQITKNMLCSIAEVDAHLMRTGTIADVDFLRIPTAMGNLSQSPISIDDTPALSLLEIRAKSRRFQSQKGIQLIIIDYLQLMEGSSAENRQQEITSISRGLKALAKELDVPVVAISQLNRSVEQREGHKPRMSDLRESGSIEQDADVVMLLHRDDYYDPNKNPGLVELNVVKQRNGPIGTINLKFIKNMLRFKNHNLSDFI
jgi:replicative DNA helicase